ncbi:hypothetical protein P692DRAFT_20883918, partial [Suillus brevipes Sb2]
MVKSKQTCKKSTGGTAPRIALPIPSSKPVPAPREMEVDVCEQFQHNEFCLICRDGSVEEDRLFLCNTCPRVMCSHCMAIPPAAADAIESKGVSFVCISCHIGRERHGRASYSPYFGFYQKGRPLLPSFLPIRGTFEVSLHSQLSSASILMLHLILVDHDASGGCFELVSDFLRPYFPNGGFDVHTVAFNIGNDSRIDKYQLQASSIVRTLMDSNYARVVVAITNHTDNDHGDPFIGYQGRTKTY